MLRNRQRPRQRHVVDGILEGHVLGVVGKRRHRSLWPVRPDVARLVLSSLFDQRERQVAAALTPGPLGLVARVVEDAPVCQADCRHIELERVTIDRPGRLEASSSLGNTVEVGCRVTRLHLDDPELHHGRLQSHIDLANPRLHELALRAGLGDVGLWG